MDEAWKTLIQVAPWGFVIIVLRWLDIQDDKEKRKERDDNAAEKAQSDRENQRIVAKMYADAINALAKSFDSSANLTAASIRDLKETLLEQYRKLGTTQNLKDEISQLKRERDEQ